MCLLNLVPLWSTDWDTEASSSISYFVLCFLGMPELNIPHLTPFCKTGLAKYFLWFFLPLEQRMLQSKPASSVDGSCQVQLLQLTQNLCCCHGILPAQPFISHPYPTSLFTWDCSRVSQAPTAL